MMRVSHPEPSARLMMPAVSSDASKKSTVLTAKLPQYGSAPATPAMCSPASLPWRMAFGHSASGRRAPSSTSITCTRSPATYTSGKLVCSVSSQMSPRR